MLRIGIAGPISVCEFKEFLYPAEWTRGQQLGLGGSQLNQLGRELLRRNLPISIFSLDPYLDEATTLRGPNLKIYLGPYRRRAYARAHDFFRKERSYIQTAIACDDCQIVHAHWSYEFALGALSTSRPVVVTVRDWAPAVLTHSPDLYRFVRFLMNRRTFTKAKYLVATSPYIRSHIVRVKSTDVPVIPNALDESRFRPEHRELGGSGYTIVSINNGFGTRKNVGRLLGAFKSVQNQLDGCRLHLVGNGYECGGPANEWAVKHELDEGVCFIGEVSHETIFSILDSADLLVHTSLEESFGNTLIEAMARRVPVIGGIRSGAVPWVLGGGEAGRLTDVTSSEAISDSILEILTDQALWRHYSDAGFRRASMLFNMPAIANQYLALYDRVLAEDIQA